MFFHSSPTSLVTFAAYCSALKWSSYKQLSRWHEIQIHTDLVEIRELPIRMIHMFIFVLFSSLFVESGKINVETVCRIVWSYTYLTKASLCDQNVYACLSQFLPLYITDFILIFRYCKAQIRWDLSAIQTSENTVASVFLSENYLWNP